MKDSSYKYSWTNEYGWTYNAERMFPLGRHKKAACGYDWIDNGNGSISIFFYSYKTLVIQADIDLKYSKVMSIWCSGLYSRTTIKHIGWFLKHFSCSISYHDIKNSLKDMVEGGKMINCLWCGYNPV